MIIVYLLVVVFAAAMMVRAMYKLVETGRQAWLFLIALWLGNVLLWGNLLIREANR